MDQGEATAFLGIDRGGWLLFAAQALSGLGTGPFVAFGAIYQRQLGATPVEIGLMAAFGMVVGTLAMVPGTRLADRADLRRTIVAGWLLAVPAPLFFLAATHWSLTAVGLVFLTASVVNTPAIHCYLTLGVPRDRIATVMTTVLSAFSLGLILSTPLTGWLAQMVGIRWLFLVSFVLYVLAGLCILLLPPKAPSQDMAVRVSYRELLRYPAFLALAVLFTLVTLVIFLPWAFTPLFAREVARADDLRVGVLMGVLYLGSVLCGTLLARLRRVTGSLAVVLCFQAAYILSAFLLLSSDTFAVLSVAFFLRGAFWSFRQVMTAVIGEILPTAALAKGYGLFALVSGAAAAAAYPVGGWLYARHPSVPFWSSALLMGLAMGATLLVRGSFHVRPETVRIPQAPLAEAA